MYEVKGKYYKLNLVTTQHGIPYWYEYLSHLCKEWYWNHESHELVIYLRRPMTPSILMDIFDTTSIRCGKDYKNEVKYMLYLHKTAYDLGLGVNYT